MLWVFVGQTSLIICLFVWGEDLPPWIDRVIVVAVFGLPLVAYLTVLAQPSVRDNWGSFLRGLYQGVISIPSIVKSFFTFTTITSLVRFVISMKTFPETRDGWIALPLFPFKAYVVLAFPFVYICLKLRAAFHPIALQSSEVGGVIILGYVYSITVLLVGALIQALVCRSGRATNTICFILYGIGLISLSIMRHL